LAGLLNDRLADARLGQQSGWRSGRYTPCSLTKLALSIASCIPPATQRNNQLKFLGLLILADVRQDPALFWNYIFMTRTPPAFFLCLGLPGSASTWVFNIAAHLLSQPPRSLVSGYLDKNLPVFLEQLKVSEKSVDVVLLKSHQADAGVFEFLSNQAAPCVLSIRDPRDCVVSLMERFGYTFDYALAAVRKSCVALLMFRGPSALELRYETHFYQSGATLAALRQHLTPDLAIDLNQLAQMYSRAAIDHHIKHFDYLPPGRIQKRGDDEYDGIAHWHRNHFGDGLSGKWRSRLDADQIALANQALGEALQELGYSID